MSYMLLLLQTRVPKRAAMIRRLMHLSSGP